MPKNSIQDNQEQIPLSHTSCTTSYTTQRGEKEVQRPFLPKARSKVQSLREALAYLIIQCSPHDFMSLTFGFVTITCTIIGIIDFLQHGNIALLKDAFYLVGGNKGLHTVMPRIKQSASRWKRNSISSGEEKSEDQAVEKDS